MIVLGLDTATTATVAGVLDASGTVFEVRDDPEPGVRPGHANRLLPAAELPRTGADGWLLALAGLTLMAAGVALCAHARRAL